MSVENLTWKLQVSGAVGPDLRERFAVLTKSDIEKVQELEVSNAKLTVLQAGIFDAFPNIQRRFQRRSNIVVNTSNQGNQSSMNISINVEDDSNERVRLFGGAQLLMGLSELYGARNSRR